MKATYFPICVVLSTMIAACSTNDELVPGNEDFASEKGVGYIALEGVTADVETRAIQTVSDLTAWTVVVTNSESVEKFNGAASGLATQAFDAEKSPYTLTVSNYASLDAALAANSGWGDAWYSGNNTVTVEKGKTTAVTVACGAADDARLGVSFDASFTSVATGYSITAVKSGVDGGLVFNASTPADKYAYYNGGTTVSYTLAYTFGGESKSFSRTVALGANGTQKTLNVMLNSNGKVALSITYNDSFTTTTEDITIDGGSGEVL